MFVFIYKWLKRRRFPHARIHADDPPPRAGLAAWCEEVAFASVQVARGINLGESAARERHIFEWFPYVRPEPVLVK
jgi:hypothetical protein